MDWPDIFIEDYLIDFAVYLNEGKKENKKENLSIVNNLTDPKKNEEEK
jgi:hypothetical protein